MLGRIIGWLLVVAIGGALMRGSNRLTLNFGHLERAEKNLGGTRNGYLLLGVLFFVGGRMIVFGVFDPSTTPDVQFSN